MTGEKRVEADVVHVDGVTILTTLNKGRKMHELSTEIEKLVSAVRETGKAGSISMELSVKPTAADATQVFVSLKIVGKHPKPDEKETLFFTTRDNALVRNNPEEQDLPFGETNG